MSYEQIRWLHGPTLSKTYTHKLWRQPAPESRQPGKHCEARNFPGRGRHRPHAIPGSTCYRWCRSTRAFDGHVGVRNHRAGRTSHGELECAGHARGLSHASVAAAAYHSNSSDASHRPEPRASTCVGYSDSPSSATSTKSYRLSPPRKRPWEGREGPNGAAISLFSDYQQAS